MKSMKSMKSMKLMKFTALFLIVISILSCSEEESMENDNLAPQNSFKKIDMNSVGSNYSQLRRDIQSHNNLDFTIGEMNFEMRNMKPVEGLDVENTIILEDEIGDRTIIVDNNVRSIYVRYTDNANEINYTLYGYEDPKLLAGLLKTKEYNIDLLRQNRSSKNVSNKFNEKLHFKSTETSFVLGKVIVTTKEEYDLLNIQQGSLGVKCSESEVIPFENATVDRTAQVQPVWFLVMYKRDMTTNTAPIIDALNNIFKSLNSDVEYFGSDQYGFVPLLKSNSNKMYIELGVKYKQAPSNLYHYDSDELFIRFENYLASQGERKARARHFYMYLNSESTPFKDGINGLATYESPRHKYRFGLSANVSSTFAHEVGHCFGAKHFDNFAYDMTETDTYYLAYSVMYSTYGGFPELFKKEKFYGSLNRDGVKARLLR